MNSVHIVTALSAVLLSFCSAVSAQPLSVVKKYRQRSFAGTVPAGDYSGITWIGGNRYAVVCDKAAEDGFFIFSIDIDSISGKIERVENMGYRSSGEKNRDMEGIAYSPHNGMIYISGEEDNNIKEYTLDGTLTGRMMAMPEVMRTATHNKGLEALTYNAVTHRFWTTTESALPIDGEQATSENRQRNRLRLQSFNDSLQPSGMFFYTMEPPHARRGARWFAHGVSALSALDDGSLLVLEREFFTSKKKRYAYVRERLFQVGPGTPKREVCRLVTRLNIFRRGLANFEGMTLAPPLADGRLVLLLISDSQHQYHHVLKDFFKTIILE